MNRRKATVFVVENGYDNLSQSLKTFLDTRSEHAYYCVDYPLANVLWIDARYIDEVLSNSEFWDCLVNDDITSRQRFKVRIFVDDPDVGEISNDNNSFCSLVDRTSLIIPGDVYVSNEDYQNNFVLTASYVDSIVDIKDWIRTRKIDSEFDLRRSDEVLKDGVKNYYNLTDEIEEIEDV